MNVLYLYEQPFIDGLGGTETYLRQMVYGLKNIGHTPIVVYPILDASEKHLLPGVECHPLLIKRCNSYQERVYNFIKALEISLPKLVSCYKIESVHLTFGWYLLVNLDYGFFRKHGIKVIATVHNVPPQEHSYTFPGDRYLSRFKGSIKYLGRVLKSYLEIKNIDNYLEIVVPCDNVKKRLRRYGCKNVIHVINHGYNDKINNAQPRSISQHQNEKFEILCVAGVARGKNQQLLINIISKIKNNENYKVHLVGNIKRCFPYYEYLVSQIKKNKLDDIFVFHPSCSDEELDKLYRMCDLYVQPSKDEGFCLSALDAAAYGMPVIGSDVGEISNIANLSGGKVVKFNSSRDFRKAIEYYNNNRNKIVDNSYLIKRYYNWDKSLNELINVLLRSNDDSK